MDRDTKSEDKRRRFTVEIRRPLLLDAHVCGNGVNCTLYCRHGTWVKHELYKDSKDTTLLTTVELDPLVQRPVIFGTRHMMHR